MYHSLNSYPIKIRYRFALAHKTSATRAALQKKGDSRPAVDNKTTFNGQTAVKKVIQTSNNGTVMSALVPRPQRGKLSNLGLPFGKSLLGAPLIYFPSRRQSLTPAPG
ncbi:hypothetical protein ACVWZY_001423 [Ewingella americana]